MKVKLNRHRAGLTGGAAILALMLAACAAGKGPGHFRDGDTDDEHETIVQMGASLNGGMFLPSKIAIDFEEAVRTAEGRLRVRINLRNRTRSPLQVQVETVFKDEDWRPTGERVDWTLLRLGAGETKPYEAVSTTAKPVRYTVRIRSFQ